jgi:hypothetical protein
MPILMRKLTLLVGGGVGIVIGIGYGVGDLGVGIGLGAVSASASPRAESSGRLRRPLLSKALAVRPYRCCCSTNQ